MVKAADYKLSKNNIKVPPFSVMSRKENLELQRQGGRNNLGKKKHPHYTKCRDCEINHSCERAYEEALRIRAKGVECEKTGLNPFGINIEKAKSYPLENSRCMYEIEHSGDLRNKELKSYMAFTDKNPEPLLKKIHLIFRKLEGLTEADPSFAKYAQMFYMLTNLYKMRFDGKSATNSINITNDNKCGNTTMDIKVIMSKMRGDSLPDKEPEQCETIEVNDDDDSEDDDDEDNEKEYTEETGDCALI